MKELSKAQEEELQFLMRELEKLRRRTYPSFDWSILGFVRDGRAQATSSELFTNLSTLSSQIVASMQATSSTKGSSAEFSSIALDWVPLDPINSSSENELKGLYTKKLRPMALKNLVVSVDHMKELW